jgi:formate dehydrogenase subunit gamma
MTWLRTVQSPWGQRVLIGLSWDLLWIAIGLGSAAILAHLLLAAWSRRIKKPSPPPDVLLRLPDRILRHTLASRVFHWTMAAAVLVLLGTAFLPIVGLKFGWVTIHWIAGLVLTAALLFHVVHASRKGLGLMWIGIQDLRVGWATFRATLLRLDRDVPKSGKNPVENKLFHHAVAVATLAAVVTGLVMMAKVNTPLWDRNPNILSEDVWGLVYVVHGAGSLALVALVSVHVYFGLRPDKRWITLSMIRGWIPRERFAERHDPSRWSPTPAAGAASTHPDAR